MKRAPFLPLEEAYRLQPVAGSESPTTEHFVLADSARARPEDRARLLAERANKAGEGKESGTRCYGKLAEGSPHIVRGCRAVRGARGRDTRPLAGAAAVPPPRPFGSAAAAPPVRPAAPLRLGTCIGKPRRRTNTGY